MVVTESGGPSSHRKLANIHFNISLALHHYTKLHATSEFTLRFSGHSTLLINGLLILSMRAIIKPEKNTN